jgi:hypothetical protein
MPDSNNPLRDLPLEDIPGQWREHARELRRENARLRELAKEDDAGAQKRIDGALAAAREEHQAQLRSAHEKADGRVVAAEVRAAARAMGLCDLDALKLLDLSQVRVDAESGEVKGAAEVLEGFRQAKPYLFKGAPRDTAQTRAAPRPSGDARFDARRATREELEADAKARGLRIKHY